MRSLKCPTCGAEITFQDGNRDFAYCNYCGGEIMLSDEVITHRIVDEAKIKKAETERIVKLKKIEYAEERLLSFRKNAKLQKTIGIGSILLGILMFIIGLIIDIDIAFFLEFLGLVIGFLGFFYYVSKCYDEESKKDLLTATGKVSVPTTIISYLRNPTDYGVIKAMFESAGFTNIKCVPMNDISLLSGMINKPGTVSSVTINSTEIKVGGRLCDPDDVVIIYYHSKKNSKHGD